MKYKQLSRIKHEGVYFFGGRKPDGFSTNELFVLRVGIKPLQWLKPETKGIPPGPRYGHSMNYNEQMNCMILFGGRNDTLFQQYLNIHENFLNDIWLLLIESLTWYRVQSIGDSPRNSYFHQSAIIGTRFLVFGGLNESTYNSSDLFLCQLDPVLSKQYEAEKNRKILEIKKQLKKGEGNDE
eukprot:CAMPEP_0170563394 /NCGR_PEP_ID=MMETSP0211-20121228/66284_1 /TAXON_ID=311385 /ORGANISM="Pseudokeronopsis sp., Strain OXSARD2" /LENGTH=181 /DNA_ID=CAMNT_0010881561 /DNA_START=1186 /DNA_END=1731 /DNA_ORIENTATION=-